VHFTYQPAGRPKGSSLFSDTGNLFRELLNALLDPYRPELHYMHVPEKVCAFASSLSAAPHKITMRDAS
jgi:hypothetical protein